VLDARRDVGAAAFVRRHDFAAGDMALGVWVVDDLGEGDDVGGVTADNGPIRSSALSATGAKSQNRYKRREKLHRGYSAYSTETGSSIYNASTHGETEIAFDRLGWGSNTATKN